MRNIVNISLPADLTKEVERAVKNKKYASKSEFFRHLLREWLAGNLLLELEESQRERAQGKSKKMNKNTFHPSSKTHKLKGK